MSVARVLCDWLDTTHPIEHHSYDDGGCESFISDVGYFLSSVGGEIVSNDDDGYKTRWRLGDGGSLTIDHTPRFLRISASGSVLAHLRATESYMRWLSLLSSVPHKITRLDVAGDRTDCSPPHVIASLRKKFPKSCSLGRKALKTTSFLSADSEGRQTGTFYIGNRRTSKQTARIYDKSHQMLEVHGTAIPPTLRYEFTTTSKHGASLRDASEPEALFWHFASHFLSKPLDAPVWTPQDTPEWSSDPFESCPGQVLKSSVENSAQFQHWVELASKDGAGGLKYLRTLLNSSLERAERENNKAE